MYTGRMSYQSLISVDQLQVLSPPHHIIDCRFSLSDPDLGRQLYRQGHIPAAHFLDLDRDLSGKQSAHSGRHPLPDPEEFAATLRSLGINKGEQIIAYDERDGAFAARLWWLCQWIGHSQTAVLNGGLAAWLDAEGRIDKGLPAVDADGDVSTDLHDDLFLTTEQVMEHLEHNAITLLDARGAERFSGATEPIDPVAGHIPGAVNKPFTGNLDARGMFLPAEQLRERYTGIESAVHMCGSGVTACHNILATVSAGYPIPRLYAGSWSEWIRDPERPVTQANN